MRKEIRLQDHHLNDAPERHNAVTGSGVGHERFRDTNGYRSLFVDFVVRGCLFCTLWWRVLRFPPLDFAAFFFGCAALVL